MDFPELSYANPDDPLWKRWIIGGIERLSGRNRLLPLYRRWRCETIGRSDREMGDLLRLIDVTLDVTGPWTAEVATDTALVMIANHPFGIGDGLALLALAEDLRRPFRVLINKDLLKVPEVRPYALPIDFAETPEARQTNLETRAEARRLLQQGVTIVVFPAGGVATAENPFGKAAELPWKTFTARLVQQAQASVLPVYVPGQNSALFHLASRLGLTIRLSLLVSEFRRFIGRRVPVRVGAVVPFKALAGRHDRLAFTAELYAMVQGLADDRPGQRAGPVSMGRPFSAPHSDQLPS